MRQIFQDWRGRLAVFLSAQTISLFGSALVQYAIIWHITLSSSSGAMLTLSTLCGFLPQICMAPFAGVWLDRWGRKRLAMLADTGIALATLVAALALLAGYEKLWLLFAVLAVRSAGAGIQTPAVSALVPQLVPEEKLLRVNGIQSSLNAATSLLAPAASATFLGLFGALGPVLLVDVVTALVGLGLTALVPVPPYKGQGEKQEAFAAQLKEGLRYAAGTPFVRRLLGYQAVVLFLISPAAFLTPLLVSRSFGPELWRLTVGEMTYSLGMVLGGTLLALWGGLSQRRGLTLLAGAAYGMLMLGLGLAPWFGLYLLCNGCMGLCAPLYNAPITAGLQQQVPPRMQGRVFSLMQISTSCALPLGMVLFGPLADAVSVETLLVAAGCAVLAVSWGFRRWF